LGELDFGINRLGMALLAESRSAVEVEQELRRSDPQAARRTIGVIDGRGEAAASTGEGSRPSAAHRIGSGCLVAGEDLPGPAVLDAMASAFDANGDKTLDHRLMAALLAGAEAVGSRSAEQSAALITYADGRAVELFLRVDLAADATRKLRHVFDEYKLYEPMYKTRVDAPDQALTPDQVEAEVAKLRSRTA
jgi:uncharacterized Ntn-hydrolase superfamily protein